MGQMTTARDAAEAISDGINWLAFLEVQDEDERAVVFGASDFEGHGCRVLRHLHRVPASHDDCRCHESLYWFSDLFSGKMR
jgi:hypothetical protein